MTSHHWTVRVHAAASVVAWCCALNAMWLAFTLLGGVVFGVGPATVTACVLARRHARGEAVGVRDFARTWRREFVRGSVVVLPILAVAAVLWSNYATFSALPGTGPGRVATLVAFGLTLAALIYAGPMYAHYELPLWRYGPMALRFALRRPHATVLLLLVFAAFAFASAAQPILPLTVSVGAWLHTSTWLGVRFFTENQRRLAAGDDLGDHDGAGLPAEPLRIL
ncbi:YesL family protein [Dactylosporangium sp. NPDC051541]|uniref:YesL family protein n=1 Tax=Dactylosporangium sp. NPDC051541 TaxID=3363977 RepID=UPI00379019B4